ncbi:rhamnogalacturonan acetylesterase [Choiromyces venosus 120613-1]|uniref:Rhamnogalacturonan acetylesterase n=1 Tax=Choiromyces venosus 120613-1 TaxID=1336337 RepID=A0A3N4KCJ1_9PEZI|nr:rhamnogalacturonan acetylesterase [Choiromyces venosus 120613-1]
MKFPLLPFVALATLTAAKPTSTTKDITVFLCSDSTAASYNPQTINIQGFGYYLQPFFKGTFVNRARGGRSTRSFINEGLWTQLLDLTSPGDYVVIEMGHNDNGTPGTGGDVGKDRAVIPGVGEETMVVKNATGADEVVRTFGSYLRQMVADLRAVGAVPVLSGMVPVMTWPDGATLQKTWPFTEYSRNVSKTENVLFLDHTAYSVARFQELGYKEANTFFPNDNTHTNAVGAKRRFLLSPNAVLWQQLKFSSQCRKFRYLPLVR